MLGYDKFLEVKEEYRDNKISFDEFLIIVDEEYRMAEHCSSDYTREEKKELERLRNELFCTFGKKQMVPYFESKGYTRSKEFPFRWVKVE